MSNNIDHDVAEKIMGWRLSPTGKTWRDCNGDHKDRERNWRPSSDIADAERVLRRMIKLGFEPVMQFMDTKWNVSMRAGWASPFSYNDWDERTGCLEAAICISALFWIDNPKGRRGRKENG